MKRTFSLFLLLLLILVSGCSTHGSAVIVDSIVDSIPSGKRFFVIVGEEMYSNDIEFKRISKHLSDVLKYHGYYWANSEEEADVCMSLFFSDKFIKSSYSFAEPVYAYVPVQTTYYSGSYTAGNYRQGTYTGTATRLGNIEPAGVTTRTVDTSDTFYVVRVDCSSKDLKRTFWKVKGGAYQKGKKSVNVQGEIVKALDRFIERETQKPTRVALAKSKKEKRRRDGISEISSEYRDFQPGYVLVVKKATNDAK